MINRDKRFWITLNQALSRCNNGIERFRTLIANDIPKVVAVQDMANVELNSDLMFDDIACAFSTTKVPLRCRVKALIRHDRTCALMLPDVPGCVAYNRPPIRRF